MALVNIKIDGQAYQVEAGLTILEAARKCGFVIPSLEYPISSRNEEKFLSSFLCLVWVLAAFRMM